MPKEKKTEIKMGLPEWMGTYGDMVTLLLCFFVLMFASSSPDAAKFAQIASSFKNTSLIIKPEQTSGMMKALGNGLISMPKVEGDSDEKFKSQGKDDEKINSMTETFKTYFAEHNLQDKVEVEQNEDTINLIFKDGILFDSGSAEIKSNAISILGDVADEILKYPENNIKVEGHTDNRPISTIRYPNNWYLSAARAISVATYFIDDKKFSPNRISTEGYGEYRPRVPNDTPDNRATNRRVEIKILTNNSSTQTQ